MVETLSKELLPEVILLDKESEDFMTGYSNARDILRRKSFLERKRFADTSLSEIKKIIAESKSNATFNYLNGIQSFLEEINNNE